MLEWLKINVDDWDTVQDFWSNTFEARRNLLAQGIGSLDYLERFACLNVQRGQELVMKELNTETLIKFLRHENVF